MIKETKNFSFITGWFKAALAPTYAIETVMYIIMYII